MSDAREMAVDPQVLARVEGPIGRLSLNRPEARNALNEVLREQFYLALPMKPLCREDCAGLCPRCGTNRNTGSCSCVTEPEDPRLAPLRGLKEVVDRKSTTGD